MITLCGVTPNAVAQKPQEDDSEEDNAGMERAEAASHNWLAHTETPSRQKPAPEPPNENGNSRLPYMGPRNRTNKNHEGR